MKCQKKTILVTGSSGYVGGRLAHRLQDTKHRLRCMARTPSQLEGRFSANVEIVHGDVTEPATLKQALDSVDTAFYLVHSLASSGDLELTEQSGAQNFANAAREAGVGRIVYLGGLGGSGSENSAHMRSRHAVGEILRRSGVETLEFRASVIIGAGSLSFELIRSLVRRLPVMLVPRWVRVKSQPIAIDDVIDYLVEAIDIPLSGSTIYEIGGAEQMSYLDLMKCYGEASGLNRLYLNVPVLTPRLSSLWLNMVTPLFASVGRKLIDSITVPSVVSDTSAFRDFHVVPVGVKEAILKAEKQEDEAYLQTRWTDALSASPTPAPYGGKHVGSRIVDSRVTRITGTPDKAFAVIEGIGGTHGWYYANWLWRIRGVLDRILGGVGMQRGRRDPHTLRTGDVLDCWRVEAMERPNRLVLRAEMIVFGRAWLQFEVGRHAHEVEIRQTAIYEPKGIAGILYWYTLYPLHQLVFAGMLRNIAQLAGDAHTPIVKKLIKQENRMDSST